MPEAITPPGQVIVYICPEEDCPNYYGATDFVPGHARLDEVQSRRGEHGERVHSHTRLECPTCRTTRGKRVERKAHIVTQVVPLELMLKELERRRDASNDQEGVPVRGSTPPAQS